ncbi:protein of unknown function [Filimonas lacunae]|uniref:DUF4202 domain-containing protein n=1 Tax=Filimonas lacunae TaxID=477680 RepID=A0A173MI81_9BACT|nr:DUF4202 domain-containing protein [Filimonas lacunae]BAV07333.1 hypothetical protein FLA_3356 [Filimonas lacunae]SIS91200.1 protein of unknown function [Filimonas lacunae]
MDQLNTAFELFDAYNQQDPLALEWNGQSFAREYFYALRLYEWVLKLSPHASEPLQLAARCQHIGRWEKPRNTYPEGRVGYLTWKNDLSKFHAVKAAEILRSVGYDENSIQRVSEIVLKKRLASDPDVQTMENALCLVFLEYQYDDLIATQPDDKMIAILQKTWGKMTEPGRQAALALQYSDKGLQLIQQALQ